MPSTHSAEPFTVEDRALSAIDIETRAVWGALARAAGQGIGAVWATPAVVETFEQVFGDCTRVSVLLMRDDSGTLRGVLPLMRNLVRRGPSLSTRYAYLDMDRALLNDDARTLLALRQVSTPLAMQATILRSVFLCAPTDRHACLATAARHLPGLAQDDLVTLSLTQDEAAIFETLAKGSWRVSIDRQMRRLSRVTDGETWLSRQSQKYRQNIRRGRRFSDGSGIVLSVIQGAKVTAHLPEFTDLQFRSWKVTGSSKSQAQDLLVPWEGRQAQFFEALCGMDDPSTVIFEMREDGGAGRLVAALYCFVHGTEMHTVILLVDLSYARYSLGHLLLLAALDYASARGLSTIDYNSNANWTERFADTETAYENVHLPGAGLRGTVLGAIGRAVARRRSVARPTASVE
jgi:CelD/BcsL family acetyltransferase involved in cellulose biosynthesis